MPELEHEERPELFAVVGAALLVFVLEFLDVGGVEESVLAEAFGGQEVAGEGAEAALEPVGDGDAEAFFGAFDDEGREHRRGGLFEDVFSGGPAQFVFDGQAGGVFRHARVEEGRARFQRNRHRRAVNFGQDVLRHVKPHVERLHLFHEVGGVGFIAQEAAGFGVEVAVGGA